VGFTIPKKNVALSIGKMEDKLDFLPTARKLRNLGFKLYATEGTSEFLRDNDIPNTKLYKMAQHKNPNLINYLGQKKLDLVVNIPKSYSRAEETAGYLIRRKAIDMEVPLITNLQIAEMIVGALARYKVSDLKMKPWGAYS
jgi:carbamoyl-phosphate synthase large subunit